MARGDYFDVTLKGEKPIRVQATRVGATVDLDDGAELPAIPPTSGRPGVPAAAARPFVTISELDKAGQPIRVFKFAKDAVVVIQQGSAPVKR